MQKNYDAQKLEQEMQEFWAREQIYHFDPGAPGELYSIDTPPPTVSGSLHIGHIFSYAQAEMIARFQRMQGKNVFYPFGFDDNGLPTERLVEREKGIRANQIPRSEFVKICDETAVKYEDEFMTLWKSLGFSVDWNLKYRTIDEKVQKISQRSFLKMAAGKKAYLKESPVLWCPECRTSIAQAELETKETDSVFCHIPFFHDGEMIIVATTRPELLYGCVCLFVNPADTRFAGLIGEMVKVPVFDHLIPVIGDEKADMEKGTGIVMCATFGDSTDAEWYQEHELPYRETVTESGRLAEEIPYVGGMKVAMARSTMIELLRERGLLLKEEPITHMTAHHERCGKSVEIIPSRQWYIDILSEKERYLAAADEINWYPGHMKTRYLTWVQNLKWDWCISRQRYFGVPFPVWYCKDCGEPVFAAMDSLPVDPTKTAYEGSCSCGCREFIPETAVMDTWATSSLSPQINARWGDSDDFSDQLLPMGMRTQAHEIIRTWAFYTIVKSLFHTGQIPWKDIMICGFVLAKRGEKISKSKNNSGLSPQNLIQSHSADALRYWAANTKLGTDSYFAEDELKIPKRFLTKLWNAARFSFLHLEHYEPDEEYVLTPVDRWMTERVTMVTREAARLLESYEIGAARQVIDELFWKDFCDNYLEIVKERLYQPEKHGLLEQRGAQRTLYHALLAIIKLYAIYVPHITEVIYQEYFRKYEEQPSIHQCWWDYSDTFDQTLLTFGEYLKAAISDMRKYKSENNLSMKAELERLTIAIPKELQVLFLESQRDIMACSGAKEIVYSFMDGMDGGVLDGNGELENA